MSRTVLLIGVLVVAGSGARAQADAGAAKAAATQPSPPASPRTNSGTRKVSKAEQRRYRAALRAGRARMAKNDARGAIASFEQALVAIPDDARALSELGFAAFKARDLTKARQATEQSIAAAGDPRLRAASMYNLGRILEAQDKKSEALDVYRRSLALRPNIIVRDRVVALDPDAKPDEPIAPVELQGPFPTLEAYCAAAAQVEPDEPCRTSGDEVPTLPTVTLEKPYQQLAMLQTGFAQSCSLAIRTAAGWFVHEEFAECRLMGGRWDRSVSFDSLTLRDIVAGGTKELVLEMQTDETFNDTPPDAKDDEMVISTEHTRGLLICGVGASGKPSCTPLVVVEWAHDEDNPSVLEAKFEDSAIVLRLVKGGGGDASNGGIGVIGKHPLRFP
jgi:tetratricopeptide (TPR) repeat protein